MRISELTRALVALTCGVAASCAFAQSSAPVKNPIIAAIVPNYPPFEYKDPATDKLSGFDVDLGEALAAKLGVKLQWEETSFDQMVSAVSTKRVDMILSGMTDTAPRHETVSFVDYITTGPQFYTLKTKAGDFPNMDALCGKRVGTSRRTTFPTDIAAWSDAHCVKAGKPAVVVVGTDGSADARLQLKQSRIDAAVQGGETLPYQNSVEQNAYAPIGKPFIAQYTGIGVGKDNHALQGAMQHALEQIIADGTYEKILKKWGLQEHAVQKAMLNAGN
ncbi:ABC transporter substrate-binding protein [Burkholderia guangdongensis]|uniref:ABC transporter substrate-binding protein n=1 Tax=Burkholderia guangdongensis TaxID=1792500 RepID=UPI0015C90050|nr:ABC transporter substrate-binding protein [Burkholderia guangdongensis]